MPDIIESVRAFLTEHDLTKRSMGIAVSGGRDSICLLAVIHELSTDFELTLSVLHYDHALRAESSEDAAFVAAEAAKRGLTFFSERARRLPSATVSENVARHERYDFFARTALAHGLTEIATAHTADDQAETVLFRLMRGSGTRGLGGIPPVRDANGYRLIRPMLMTRREDVASFLASRGLEHREDASNASMRFARNRIRHRILPFLVGEGAPSLVQFLNRMSGIARSEDDYLEARVDDEITQWRREAGRWYRATSALESLHIAVRARVFARLISLSDSYPAFETIDAIERILREGGRVDLAGAVAAWVEDVGGGRTLVIGRSPQRPLPLEEAFSLNVSGETSVAALGLRVLTARHPHAGRVRELRRREARPVRLDSVWRATAVLDARSIEGELRIRTRRAGDRMTPFGLAGTKKLHDIFIDEKVSLAERDRWPILCDDRGILWVIGLKQDERTRISESTTEILRVDIESKPIPGEPTDAA